MIRILIADDQELVRSGFGLVLAAQPDLEVVGEAADGAQAVDLALRTTPDVVLMDVRMPRMDGIEATERIMRGTQPPRVLILTTFDLDEYVYDALRAGASGFLLKDASRHDLVRAVRVVAAGDALLAPSVTRRLIAEYARLPPEPPPDSRHAGATAGVATAEAAAQRLAVLTAREREVLALLARGLTNAELADTLVVSEHTVKTHVSNVLLKLELRDRVQAVIAAYETGLVAPGRP